MAAKSLTRPFHIASAFGLLSILTACSVTAPIQPATSSKSGFDSAVYKGTTVTVSPGTPGSEQYRVFQQGATGFVSLQAGERPLRFAEFMVLARVLKVSPEALLARVLKW